MPKQAQWIENRLKYIAGLKRPSQQQQLFAELGTKTDRTSDEEKQFKICLKLEKLAEQKLKADTEMASIKNAAKLKTRKARDHELYQCAGLMSLAGLVNKTTGMPMIDRAELLGALMGLASVPEDDPRRKDWKNAGEKKFAEFEKKTTNKSAEPA